MTHIRSAMLSNAPPLSVGAVDADLRHALNAIDEAGRSLFELGLLSATRTFNAAVRTHSQTLIVAGFQPRGGGLESSAVRVDLRSGEIEADDSNDLREFAQVYAALFGLRPEILSAAHTRSPHLAAFAVAHRPLPVIYGTGLLKRTPIPVPVSPWTARLSAHSILATLKAHPRAPALLLANRGVLAWGNEPIDKLVRFIASLEEVATIAVRAQILGGARALPAGAFEIVQNSIDGD